MTFLQDHAARIRHLFNPPPHRLASSDPLPDKNAQANLARDALGPYCTIGAEDPDRYGPEGIDMRKAISEAFREMPEMAPPEDCVVPMGRHGEL